MGSFLKTAGAYLAGNVLTKIVSFFLLPLYTSAIDPASFGEYNLVVSVLNMAVPVCFLCVWDSVFRFAFDCEEAEGKYRVFSACFVVMLAGCVVLALGVAAAFAVFGFGRPVLVGVYGIMMAFQYYYAFAARAFRHNGLFIASGCACSVVVLVLNVLLIVGFSFGVDALYVSYIVGVAVQLAMIESRERILKHLSLRVSLLDVRRYLAFSSPVAGSAVATWFLGGFTQALIVAALGSYYNGLYGVASKFSSILALVMSAFQFAWSEMAYDLSREECRRRYYTDGITEMLRFSTIGAALLIVAVKLVYPVMVDPSYAEGLAIVPLLLIGATANSCAGFLGTLYLAEKRPSFLPRTIVLAGLVNVISSLVLVRLFGFTGAIAALCIAYFVLAAMRLLSVKRLFGASLHGDYVVALLLLAASVVSFYLFDFVPGLVVVLVGLLVVSMLVLWPQLKRLLQLGKGRR